VENEGINEKTIEAQLTEIHKRVQKTRTIKEFDWEEVLEDRINELKDTMWAYHKLNSKIAGIVRDKMKELQKIKQECLLWEMLKEILDSSHFITDTFKIKTDKNVVIEIKESEISSVYIKYGSCVVCCKTEQEAKERLKTLIAETLIEDSSCDLDLSTLCYMETAIKNYNLDVNDIIKRDLSRRLSVLYEAEIKNTLNATVKSLNVLHNRILERHENADIFTKMPDIVDKVNSVITRVREGAQWKRKKTM
jgi:hypothetical protein